MELVLRPVNKDPLQRTSEHPGDTHCMVKMEIILAPSTRYPRGKALITISRDASNGYH